MIVFRIGDKIVLRWPERSNWAETKYDIHTGHLSVGATYEVFSLTRLSDQDAVYIKKRNLGFLLGISSACFELEKKSKAKNLPDWW